MSLDDLLKPVLKPIIYMDEQVARLYTQAAVKLGVNEDNYKAFVSSFCDLSGIITVSVSRFALTGSAESSSDSFVQDAIGLATLSLFMLDMMDGWYRFISSGRSEAIAGNDEIIDRTLLSYNAINKVLRLPVFAVGAYSAVSAGIDVAGHLLTGDSTVSNAMSGLTYGFGMLLLATSMYVKHTDPKFLDKAPFWRAVYMHVADKVGRIKRYALNPLPEPAPALAHAPVRTNAVTLDGYVSALMAA